MTALEGRSGVLDVHPRGGVHLNGRGSRRFSFGLYQIDLAARSPPLRL